VQDRPKALRIKALSGRSLQTVPHCARLVFTIPRKSPHRLRPASGVLPTVSLPLYSYSLPRRIPSTTASHESPAIRLRSSAVERSPAIRSASSSNPPSTTTAEVPAWRCWAAMVSQVARCPARSRAISPRSPLAADSAADSGVTSWIDVRS